MRDRRAANSFPSRGFTSGGFFNVKRLVTIFAEDTHRSEHGLQIQADGIRHLERQIGGTEGVLGYTEAEGEGNGTDTALLGAAFVSRLTGWPGVVTGTQQP